MNDAKSNKAHVKRHVTKAITSGMATNTSQLLSKLRNLHETKDGMNIVYLRAILDEMVRDKQLRRLIHKAGTPHECEVFMPAACSMQELVRKPWSVSGSALYNPYKFY